MNNAVKESFEPVIHSHITDVLPEDHPNAYYCVFCDSCNAMLHANNNECMQTWLETQDGNFCTNCYILAPVLRRQAEQALQRHANLKKGDGNE